MGAAVGRLARAQLPCRGRQLQGRPPVVAAVGGVGQAVGKLTQTLDYSPGTQPGCRVRPRGLPGDGHQVAHRWPAETTFACGRNSPEPLGPAATVQQHRILEPGRARRPTPLTPLVDAPSTGTSPSVLHGHARTLDDLPGTRTCASRARPPESGARLKVVLPTCGQHDAPLVVTQLQHAERHRRRRATLASI